MDVTEFAFQSPSVIPVGLLVVAALMVWFAMRLRSRDVPPRRAALLVSLRVLFLGILTMLAARPVWKTPDADDQTRDQVVLLIDRSQSMAVREGDQTRYQQAVRFARDVLLPSVDQSRLTVRPVLFADDSREVSGEQIATAAPDGESTNLGRALVSSVLASEPPPLVVIALTDGNVTNRADHSRATSVLMTHAVPVVGIGFGSEAGGRVVGVEAVDAPTLAEPGQMFWVTGRLNATGASIPPLDVLLLRDGQLVDRRRVSGFEGPRSWTERFQVTVDTEGLHTYAIRVMPPADQGVTISSGESATVVRVDSSDEMRVLYVQGGLTWDYKFINLAVSKDSTLRLSGLSRTASTSRFFENVQSDVDLVNGFPATLEKLREFRVVVLSNLHPGDLTPHQQQLLADFCGELGGGVLMIGGPQTFNASWRDSRLEQLLPVRFAVLPGQGASQSFQLRPTETAGRNPVFQIADDRTVESAWSDLPRFTHRAVVDGVKPGAEVWLTDNDGAVLMASQRYGRGAASVICMQNLWRWRLARESNPQHFDRFWTQLLRYLADAGREAFTLTPSEMRPRPGDEIELMIEHRAAAGEQAHSKRVVRLLVRDPQQTEVADQTIELQSGRQASVTFTAETSGMFTALLQGAGEQVLANREINVHAEAAELASTSRDMETLRQFAGISGGVAVEADAQLDVPELLRPFLDPELPPRVEVSYAMPAGINVWMLILLLACISAEWLFRKRWNMM